MQITKVLRNGEGDENDEGKKEEGAETRERLMRMNEIEDIPTKYSNHNLLVFKECWHLNFLNIIVPLA